MPEPLLDRILTRLDRLSAQSAGDTPEGRRRGGALVAAAMLGGVMMVVGALTLFRFGSETPLACINLAGASAFVAVIFFSRWLRSKDLLANAIVAIGFCQTLLLSSLMGGRSIGTLFAFAVFPMIAVLLAGWRSGLVFTALAIAGAILTPMLPLSSLAPPHLAAAPLPVGMVRDVVSVILAAGLLSALYDAMRNSSLREADRALRGAEASDRAARRVADRQRQLVDLSQRLQAAAPLGRLPCYLPEQRLSTLGNSVACFAYLLRRSSSVSASRGGCWTAISSAVPTRLSGSAGTPSPAKAAV